MIMISLSQQMKKLFSLIMDVFPNQILGHGINNQIVPHFYPYLQSGFLNVVSRVFNDGEGGVGRRVDSQINVGFFLMLTRNTPSS